MSDVDHPNAFQGSPFRGRKDAILRIASPIDRDDGPSGYGLSLRMLQPLSSGMQRRNAQSQPLEALLNFRRRMLDDSRRDCVHVVGYVEVVQDAVAQMGIGAVEAHPFPIAGFIEAVDGNLDFPASNSDAVDEVIQRIIKEQQRMTPIDSDRLPRQPATRADLGNAGANGAE